MSSVSLLFCRFPLEFWGFSVVGMDSVDDICNLSKLISSWSRFRWVDGVGEEVVVELNVLLVK